MWYVYILQCSDKSYYVGHTNNLNERIDKHNAGRAVRWTACRLPIHIDQELSEYTVTATDCAFHIQIFECLVFLHT